MRTTIARHRIALRSLLLILAAAFLSAHARAQDNYEIQICGADTVTLKTTMLEPRPIIDKQVGRLAQGWPFTVFLLG